MIEEPPTLPIWIVTGTNWSMQIPMNEFNSQFDKEHQMWEAATQAIEVLRNVRNDFEVIMNADSRNENPFLGTHVAVHLKDTDPEKAEVLPVHICMSNTGLYKESVIMSAELAKQVAIIEKNQAEKEKSKQETKRLNDLGKEVGKQAIKKMPKKKK